VQKNKAYFKRYQVKWRRRRAGKTDYRARLRMVIQDKNKYSAPRYRLVVRITNRTVICQIVHSEIDGDHVLCAAYSSELPRYGLKVGLKNYAAAYSTGLLVARRTLAKLGLDKDYPGNDSAGATVVSTTHTNDAGATRQYWVKEVAGERKPFRCVLDVGIAATTTGARIFGALKGAADGGLDIPHNEKRFPGYNRDDKKYKPETHRERIFANHIGSYMQEVQEEDPETFAKRFSKYIEHDVDPDGMEDLIKSVHEAIRADPSPAPKKAYTPDKSFRKPAKLSLEERRARNEAKRAARLAEAKEKAAAGGGDDEEAEEDEE
jgi:large subunit ribosomal protein L5e